MSMRDVLLPVAKARGRIRLVDGRIVTLVGVKTSRIRVQYTNGQTRTLHVSDVLEVIEMEKAD